MKNNNFDTHDTTNRGLISQYKPLPSKSKSNGHFSGNGKSKYIKERFWAPRKSFHLDLKPYHTLVFLYLCHRSNKVGICYPKQVTIAKELGISRITVSRAVKELTRRNLIQVRLISGDTFQQNKKKFEHNEYRILLESERKPRISQLHGHVSDSYTKKVLKEKELKENILKESFNKHSSKGKELNGSSNRNGADKNINESHPEGNDNIPYKEILADLNGKAGTNFRHTTKAHRNKIKARWNEGNTLEDFQRVHSNRVAYWKGDPKMEQYLRPSTLYINKFEDYLNAPFPKGNGLFNHTPYKPRANKYEGNKTPDEQTIEMILPHKNKCGYCKSELTDKNKQVMAYFHSDFAREVMQLCSICISKYPGNWTVVEESNELRVQHLKENDNRDVIQAPRETIPEGCYEYS